MDGKEDEYFVWQEPCTSFSAKDNDMLALADLPSDLLDDVSAPPQEEEVMIRDQVLTSSENSVLESARVQFSLADVVLQIPGSIQDEGLILDDLELGSLHADKEEISLHEAVEALAFDSVSTEKTVHVDIIKPKGEAGKGLRVPPTSIYWRSEWRKSSEDSMLSTTLSLIESRVADLDNLKCTDCGIIFLSTVQLQKHVAMEHGKFLNRERCMVCSKLFVFQDTLKDHLAVFHNILYLELTCQLCYAEFGSQADLQGHLSNHKKTFACHTCNALCLTEIALLDHQESHLMEEKPHQCETCGARFCTHSVMASHQQRHFSSSCLVPNCQVSFDTDLTMWLHLKDHNKSDKERLIVAISAEDKREAELDRLLFSYLMLGSGDDTLIQCLSHMCTAVTTNSKREDVLSDNHDGSGDEAPAVPSRRACPICRKRLKSLDLVKRHFKIHLRRAETGHRDEHVAKSSLKCRSCRQVMGSEIEFVKHVETHLSDVIGCDICGKTFSQTWHKASHMEKAHETEMVARPYSCNICLQKFKVKKNRDMHLLVHTGGNVQQWTCDKCSQVFPGQRLLQSHMSSHEKEYVCPLPTCRKPLNSASHVKSHMRLHQPEKVRKRFKCTHCQLLFPNESSMAVHIRTHTGERPFMCMKCGVTFKRKQALSRHEQNVHSKSPSSSQMCPVCNTAFTVTSNLIRHLLRVHHDFRRFICGVCGVRYGHHQDLRRHLKQKHGMEMPVIQVHDKKSNNEVYVIPPLSELPENSPLSWNLQAIVEDEVGKLDTVSNFMAQVPGKRQMIETVKATGNQRTKSAKRIERPVLPKPQFMCRHCNMEMADQLSYTLHLQMQVTLECKVCNFRCCNKKDLKVHQYAMHETLESLLPVSGLLEELQSSQQKSSAMNSMTMLNLGMDSESLQNAVDLLSMPPDGTLDDAVGNILSSSAAASSSQPPTVTITDSIPAQRDINLESLLTFSDGAVQPELMPGTAAINISDEFSSLSGMEMDSVGTVDPPHGDQSLMESHSDTAGCRFELESSLDVRDEGGLSTMFDSADDSDANLQICQDESAPERENESLIQPVTKLTSSWEQKVSCKECKKEFNDLNQLERHCRVHGEKRHKCEVCGKAFLERHNMRQHMMTHTGERPLQCEVCGKAFRYPKDVTDHMTVHTGEKPHKCGTCSKEFVRLRDLNRHMTIHTGVKKHVCPACGKSFARLDHLKNKHMRVHEDKAIRERFKCETCGKDFLDKQKLQMHMKLHSGTKDYTCKKCKKSFALPHYLKSHMLTHARQENYVKCPKCPRKFSSSTTLNVHLMRFHDQHKQNEVKNPMKDTPDQYDTSVSTGNCFMSAEDSNNAEDDPVIYVKVMQQATTTIPFSAEG